MSSQNDEIERLKRLRERQLQARDPLAKQRKLERKISQQWQKKQRPTFREMIGNLSYKVKGVLIGAWIGILIWVVISVMMEGLTADLLGLVIALILSIMGYIFGQAFDAREELKDITKRW